MSWQKAGTLPWENPLDFARKFSGHDIALLHSGIREQNGGTHSFLLVDALETLSGNDWSHFPTLPDRGEALPLWVGYIGYGLREAGAAGTPSVIDLPAMRFVRYRRLFRFDLQQQRLDAFIAEPSSAADSIPTSAPGAALPAVARVQSNFTRAAYESVVRDTIEQIHRGNFYQANITRKFFGEFTATPDSFAVFRALCEASPAPYSAYIRHGATAIASSSPECFLTMNAAGHITTRPIKGSARRGRDDTEDQTIRKALQSSSKNHAENLMIVDLMRNDLAQISEPNSVRVSERSGLYSYATIHHLISTVTAQKKAGVRTLEVVRACFPPGSMTGAPKRAAIEWCATQEQQERGVYSGAIGWLGAGGCCDLSVVIRTLILDGTRFEFQVGGGIVADSTPEEEWRETLVKARGILRAIGLEEAAIEAL